MALCTLNRMPNFAPLDLRVFASAFATLGPAGEREGAAGAGAGSGGSSSSSGGSSGGRSGSGGVAGPGFRGSRGWELAEQQAEALLGPGAGQGPEGRRQRNARMMQVRGGAGVMVGRRETGAGLGTRVQGWWDQGKSWRLARLPRASACGLAPNPGGSDRQAVGAGMGSGRFGSKGGRKRHAARLGASAALGPYERRCWV